MVEMLVAEMGKYKKLNRIKIEAKLLKYLVAVNG